MTENYYGEVVSISAYNLRRRSLNYKRVRMSFITRVEEKWYINSGPWRGLRVMPISPISTNGYVSCDDCKCIMGSPLSCLVRPSYISPETPDCTCGHRFCPNCLTPLYNYVDLCDYCVSGDGGGMGMYGKKEREATLQRLSHPERPPRSVLSMRGLRIRYTAPFKYEPQYLLLADNYVARILGPELLQRDIWVHVCQDAYGRILVALTRDREATESFLHYHDNCWGNVAWASTMSNEEIASRAHDALLCINSQSLANRSPGQLPEYRDIRYEEPARNEMSWNTRAVLAASEEEREEVAMNERHSSLGLSVPRRIWIVGAGGVGWHVAMQAAALGIGMDIIDPDSIEASNLNRIMASRNHIGRRKVAVLSNLLEGYSRLSVALVSVTPDEFSENYVAGAPVIIDTTDNIESQRAIYACALRAGARYIRAGYDGGWHVTVSSREAPLWELEGTPRGYRAPAWVGGTALAATLAMVKLCYQPDLEVSVDLRDIIGHYHDASLALPIELPEEEPVADEVMNTAVNQALQAGANWGTTWTV